MNGWISSFLVVECTRAGWREQSIPEVRFVSFGGRGKRRHIRSSQMHFLLLPLQPRSSGSLRLSFLATNSARYASRPNYPSTSSHRFSSTSPTSFSEFQHLGLTPAVVESLEAAFPHIKTPSACQKGLIPAVLEPNSQGAPRDVLLRGDTGSGK